MMTKLTYLCLTIMMLFVNDLSAQLNTDYFAGEWGNNGTKIFIKGNNVVVELAPSSGRPDAFGKVNANGTITVNFTDDRTYTGKLVSPNQINWGGNNNWFRSKLPTFFFAGEWGNDGTKIYIHDRQVIVKLAPKSGRPDGVGNVNEDGTITVHFKDDRTYTGHLISENQINWGGNNNWFRRHGQVSDFAGDWGNDGTKIIIKGTQVVVKLAPKSGRPDGIGQVNKDGTITVHFKDDRTYTGKLVSAHTIMWGKNNYWHRNQNTYSYYAH